MNPGRRMLLLLAALFSAPLLISFLMYYGHRNVAPAKRVNRGELLIPAVPLPAASLPLRHKWTLVFVGEGACNARCRKALYDTRQVRTALDRDMVRVQRLFVATGICCDLEFLRHEHPDLIVTRADETAAPLLDRIRAAVVPATNADSAAGSSTPAALDAAGRVYLVDPLSNLVMSYAADAAAKGMLEDLKRLLKLSQIG